MKRSINVPEELDDKLEELQHKFQLSSYSEILKLCTVIGIDFVENFLTSIESTKWVQNKFMRHRALNKILKKDKE
jgi:hypothetical protein